MPIELTELNLETLVKLEPKLSFLCSALLAQIARDCINRPTDEKARKLTLTIGLKPLTDTVDGKVMCTTAQIEVAGKVSLPEYRTAVLPVGVGKGGFVFNANCPDSLHQHTLEFGEASNET